jgi:L-lactate dehydrogenase complex protein LldE
MDAFDGLDYVAAPSGSCAAMLRLHYPRLMAGDVEAERRARAFAERVHELMSFLVDVRGLSSVPGSFAGRVTYHDGCSGLRELKVRQQPRRLLSAVRGLELVEMPGTETCCGFGGLFSVKFPDISNAMVSAKTANIASVAPDLVLSGELGCLMNVAGKLARQGSRTACRHVAEVLAGELGEPPIAQGASRGAP